MEFKSNGTVSLGLREDVTSQQFAVDVAGGLVIANPDCEAQDDPLTVAWYVERPAVQFEINGYMDSLTTENVRSALVQPTLGTTDTAGRVTSVRFDSGIEPIPGSVIRSLISTTQFVVPNQRMRDDEIWQVEEADPSGVYVAEYKIIAGGSSGHSREATITIMKTRINYVPRLSDSMQVVPSGSLTGRWDPDLEMLTALHGYQSQTVWLGNHPVATSLTSIHLHLRERTPLAIGDRLMICSSSAINGEPISLAWRQPDSIGRRLLRKKTLGEATLSELLGELFTAQNVREEPPGDISLRRKLQALVWLAPSTSDTLGSLMSRAPVGGVVFSVLGEALATADRPESQMALTTVFELRRKERAAVIFLAPLLASAVDPIPQAELALRRVALGQEDSVAAQTARLALGTMARHLAANQADRAQQIVSDLIAAYGPRPSTEVELQLLPVLGNSGFKEALELSRGLLSEQSIEIRLEAVAALRFVSTVDADSLLIEVLTTDPDPTVRLEVVRLLGSRPLMETSLFVQTGLLLSEGNENVRLALLNNLWDSRRLFPESLHAISITADGDPSPKVRSEAQRLLDSLHD